MPEHVEPLRRNRDYVLIWAGQGLSELGSQLSMVAYPLLILALTGSAAKAGVVGLAATLPLPLLALPAGLLSDRVDRKRLMVGCDAFRAAALTALGVSVIAGHPAYGVVIAVAFVDGALFTVSFVVERGVVRQLVGTAQLSDAVAMNESAFYVSSIAGPPLGGVLFALSRAVPFLGDAFSYTFSTAATLLTRGPFQSEREHARRPSLAELTSGFGWLWRRPLFRTCLMVSATGNLLYRGLYLLVVVLAKRHGASSAQVGAMFAVIGVGGLAGGLLAPILLRHLSLRRAVLLDTWVSALAMPLLLIAPGTLVTALVVAVIELPAPIINSAIQGTRNALAPDELQGRIAGAATTASQSLGWLGPLTIGLVVEQFSQTAAILALCAMTVAIALSVSVSRGMRAPATA